MNDDDTRLERIESALYNLTIMRDQEKDDREIVNAKNDIMFNDITKKLNTIVQTRFRSK